MHAEMEDTLPCSSTKHFELPRKVGILTSLLLALNLIFISDVRGALFKAIIEPQNQSEKASPPQKLLRHLPSMIDQTKKSEEMSAPRAFVCVTGQLSRLELANKEQNLFRYWNENFNVEFDVALVLSNTSNFSVRRGAIPGQIFFDAQEVHDYLQQIPGVNVLNSDNFVGSEDPVVNPQYYEQRSSDSSQTLEQKIHRVKNHVRQFETLERCHYHMNQHVSTSNTKYDIVHRVREDSGYFQVVPFDHLLEMTQRYPKTIVSSSCQQHNGINDRGSFVSPDAAYDYFVHPFVHMYTKSLSSKVKSTEQYLLSIYGKTCHMLETHKFRLFRIFSEVVDYPSGSAESRLIPGTNFDTEGGEVLRCLEGLDEDGPKRHKPKCRDFGDGFDVCVEVA